MFTNVPYEFVNGLLQEYLDTRNVIDRAWLASEDANVIDKLIPFQKFADSLRIQEAYAAVGDARVEYGQGTNAAPFSSFYTTSSNSWAVGATTGIAGTANVGWTVAKESPTEDVTVLVTQSSTGRMDIFCRTGSTWTKDISNITIGTTAATRRFDVEFEKTSGIPMVLFSNNVATTDELSYYRKTGAGCGAGSWSTATVLNPTRITGIALWVELEARQTSGSNVLAAAFSDSSATQGGILQSMIWNAGAWGNESPATAVNGWSDSSIELQGTAGANAAKVFDLAFETTSGDLFITWGTSLGSATVNGWRYATCSATLPCTWSGVLTPAGPLDDATNVACAPDPGSDAIACIAQGNAGADLTAWTWTGTAVGATTAATADATLLATAAGDMHVDIDWVVSGTQRMAVGVYAETATGVRYIYYDTVGAAWRTNTTTSFTPTGAPATALQSVQVLRNPNDQTKLLVLLSDANSDVFSLRLNYNGAAGGATTALSTWNASTGGTIETTTSSITSQAFWFDWVKFAVVTPTLTIGVTAGSKLATVVSGTTLQYAQDVACDSAAACSAFTILPSTAETLTSIKVTETGTTNGTTNLTNVALFYDTDGNYSNGVTGQFGSTIATLTTEAATITGSLAMSAATTYYFYVRYDLINGANDPVGGETVNWQIAANGDVVSGGGSTKSGAPVSLAGTQTVRPNATSTTYQLNGDGGRSTYSATVTGNGFGVAPVGSRGTCGGAVNTGCVQFVVGGTATVATADVTAWANRSITYTVNSALASNGGVSALQISSGNQTDSTPLTFYVYPTITSVTNCDKAGIPTGSFAREYNAGDAACPNTLTDGAIIITGDHFGTAGTVTVHGSTATQAAVAAFCSGAAYNATCIAVQVPTAIANNSYTGDVVVTRTTDSKTHNLTGFRVLPRITGFTPSSAANGAAVTVNGDHFCQNGGTCPTVFAAANKVTFNSAQDATVFTTWTDTAMTTAVPAAATTGNVVLTSNTSYTSNGQSFTVLSNTPASPTGLNQYKNSGLTTVIATSSVSSSTPIYLTMIMEVPGISGGTLYPQIEYKDAPSTPFTCTGTSACASAVEGTGKAGPGPVDCNVAANNCAIAISPSDNTYHWQARVCHNNGGTHTATCGGTGDYPSAWVSYGGNAESATDFQIDSTPPVITLISSGSPGTNSATITWSTAGELASTQVQYRTVDSFVSNCATNSDCTTLTDTSPRVNSHSVSLSNLNSGTTYYYRVRSVDASGNESISTPSNSFVTSSVSTPAKTTRFHIVGRTGTVTSGSPLSQDFFVYMPETAPSIKSSFIVITGIYETATAQPSTVTITAQYEAETAVVYTLPGSPSGTLRGTFKINLPVTTPTTSTSTLQVTPDGSTTVYINSADMYLNYSYTP